MMLTRRQFLRWQRRVLCEARAEAAVEEHCKVQSAKCKRQIAEAVVRAPALARHCERLEGRLFARPPAAPGAVAWAKPVPGRPGMSRRELRLLGAILALAAGAAVAIAQALWVVL